MAIAKADQSTLLPKVAELMKDANVEIQDEDLKGALDDILNPQTPAAPTE
ncbi:hypothetical protein [Planococcus faecalis]